MNNKKCIEEHSRQRTAGMNEKEHNSVGDVKLFGLAGVETEEREKP